MTQPIQTAEFWDQIADQYVNSAEPFTAQFCADIVELAGIVPGIALLDVATGPGALALGAAACGARVTAIDFSQAMIDRLAARIDGLPITAVPMDGQALDLPSDSFDIVSSNFGVVLFPDWRAGLREMTRVLKPGGRALVSTADNGHGFGPNQLLATARAELTGSLAPVEIEAWNILADRERFAEEMRAAGLDAIDIHERTHDFILDPAMFVADHPMILQNPMLAGLDDADRAAVINAAIDNAHQHADGAEIRLPGTALFAIGTKL